MSKEAMKLALEAYMAAGFGNSTDFALQQKAHKLAVEALAEQPAQQEPVALDVTLEGDEARALYDLFGDDREDLSPVRLLVGDGHSGYGLYVALAEYQDEGAELIASIIPPAQRTWIGLTDEPSPTAGMNIAQRILHVGGRNNTAGYVEFGSIQAVEALVRQVLRDLPKPKPLPAHEIVTLYEENPRSDSDMIDFARAIEAAHGIKEKK